MVYASAMRHTRQGCARGQKHGTLDREDPDIGNGGMWAATSHSAMKEQGRVAPRREAKQKLRTLSGEGCWCGKPMHPKDVAHGAPLPWVARDAQEDALVKRLTDALVKVTMTAGAQGVGVAIFCERGVPRFVAPCEHVPLNEVRWYGSVPMVQKEKSLEDR